MRGRSIQTAIAFGFALCAMSTAGLAAGIKGYAVHCPETKQICFWHKAVVPPPRGWIEDEAWTSRYQAMVLFENGDKSSDKPMMYLRAHAGEKDLALSKYVSAAQEHWLKQLPDSTIEALADFERQGKPGFKVFLYKNPSQPDQAFELTAFTKDVDSAHPEQSYFFQAVLIAPSLEELERVKPAFYELIGKL